MPGVMKFGDLTLSSQQNIVNAFSRHFSSVYLPNCDCACDSNNTCDILSNAHVSTSCDYGNKMCCPSLSISINCGGTR